MSMDTVDDLECAEDTIGELRATLERLLGDPNDPNARAEARRVLDSQVSYCRPTCGYLIDGECLDGEDVCGCPCGHEGGDD